METTSHMLMGRLLLAYVQKQYGMTLDSRNFLLGNVLPDYLPSFLSRPHFLKYGTDHVRRLIQRLSGRLPAPGAPNGRLARYSRRLGMLCHFYTDFFCYAHCAHFPPGLKRHIGYERELTLFFQEHYEALLAQPLVARTRRTPDIEARFNRLQSAYLASEHTYLNDIAYAFYACVDVIAAVCRCGIAGEAGVRVRGKEAGVASL